MAPPEILLLAAGGGRRFGGAKQLARIDGVPMVRHCALAALATGAPVSVVTGASAGAIADCLGGLPLTLVHNPIWSRGLGSSIACGARALLARPAVPAAVLLHLADLPEVTAADLERLLASGRGAPSSVVAAGFAGGTGPPCLFPHRLLAALADLDGDRGARDLVAAQGEALVVVPVAGAARDVDTPGDLAALRPR